MCLPAKQTYITLINSVSTNIITIEITSAPDQQFGPLIKLLRYRLMEIIISKNCITKTRDYINILHKY